ncbi:MAG: ubiquinone/menaquinone biosynthesis methyltransferase [Bacteroidales bacterium]|nr:ubiquinone/menaquinone biosynthesis methyltransferase [Bacteroidales bacterium]
MTFGLDRRWRRRAARKLRGKALDVACGTGDMCVELMKRGCDVTGVDISGEMLSIARQKTASANLQTGDAEALPFADDVFDAVTCAFGIRNFEHLEKGLSEMLRVLRPGGRMVILELATPDSELIKPFYSFYTKRIIPWLGQRIAGNREAYTYLPESIARFPKGPAMLKILNSIGMHATQKKFLFGVCRMYRCDKING